MLHGSTCGLAGAQACCTVAAARPAPKAACLHASLPLTPCSAHAATGPYWAQRLGVQQLRARQCSPRGGELLVDVRRGEGRVTVAGQAVMTIRGSMLLPAASS